MFSANFGVNQSFGGGGQGSPFGGGQSQFGGGGFVPSSQQMQSPMGKVTKFNRSMLPVTIKQLNSASPGDAADGKFRIDGNELGQCKIIGQIMAMNQQVTNTTYVVDDGTGCIAVRMFVGNEVDDQRAKKLNSEMKEYSYVKVFGRLTEYQGKKSISCHRILPLSDMNELTSHRLEVILTHLINTRGPMSSSVSAPMSMSSFSNPMASFGNMNATGSMGVARPNMQAPSAQSNAMSQHVGHLSPVQKAVFDVILAKTSGDSTGIRVEALYALFPQFPPHAVAEAVRYLANEGQIFSTVDDNTYKICI